LATRALPAVVRDLDINFQDDVDAFAAAINEAVDAAILAANALNRDLYVSLDAVDAAIAGTARRIGRMIFDYNTAIKNSLSRLEVNLDDEDVAYWLGFAYKRLTNL
jgi:hypothetical protein